MTVLDTADDLIKYLTSFILIHSLLLDDVVEQFSSTKELHDQEKIFWRLNDLIQLDDIGMTDKFQDVDLSCDSLNVSDVNDFVFLKYFYGDFFTGRNVSCELNFSEGALTESLFYKFKDDMYWWCSCRFSFIFPSEQRSGFPRLKVTFYVEIYMKFLFITIL